MMSEPKKQRVKPDPLLTKREIVFAQRVAEHGNATRAYREAGFEFKSEAAASTAASKLLRNGKVLAYLEKLEKAACDAAMVTIESIAQGFARAESADITTILGPDGEILPPNQWPEAIRWCITRIEVEELTEYQPDPDPDQPKRKKMVGIGTKWKVWLENKTECRKVLAQWKRMLKSDEGGPRDDEQSGGDRQPTKAPVGVLARIAALIASQEPHTSGPSGTDGAVSGGASVGAQTGPTVASVPKPG
jgi:phage terminase small subunit